MDFVDSAKEAIVTWFPELVTGGNEQLVKEMLESAWITSTVGIVGDVVALIAEVTSGFSLDVFRTVPSLFDNICSFIEHITGLFFWERKGRSCSA